jgi:hypothetical protein
MNPKWRHGANHASAELEPEVTRADLKEAVTKIELQRNALERADYYIKRLYDAHRGRVVRDLDEACCAWETALRALAPK